eukprot:gene18327-97_t
MRKRRVKCLFPYAGNIGWSHPLCGSNRVECYVFPALYFTTLINGLLTRATSRYAGNASLRGQRSLRGHRLVTRVTSYYPRATSRYAGSASLR